MLLSHLSAAILTNPPIPFALCALYLQIMSQSVTVLLILCIDLAVCPAWCIVGTPASLLWLCRRQIRKQFVRHHTSTVDGLQLPTVLKKYIDYQY